MSRKTAPRKPTPKQKVFVEAVLEGHSHNQSAIMAGRKNAAGFDRSPTVQQEIATARKELSDLTTLKRLDVIDGIMDGIASAKMQGDAGNIIKGWTEIAKILGHYAPEVRRIELTFDQQRVRSKFEALSDEELLAIQHGLTIEGEAHRIN